MGDPVHQGIPERDCQACEDKKAPDGHDRDGVTTAVNLPALQRRHRRIQHQGDEPSDQHEQHDIPQAVEDLSREIEGERKREGDEDRRQRDLFRLCRSEDPRPPFLDR